MNALIDFIILFFLVAFVTILTVVVSVDYKVKDCNSHSNIMIIGKDGIVCVNKQSLLEENN